MRAVPGMRARPSFYRPIAIGNGLVLLKAGGRFVRSDFMIARHPVAGTVFQQVVGRTVQGQAHGTTAQQATWAEAIRCCNLLSAREGRPPAYDEATAVLLDGAGNSARDIAAVKGYRLPTGGEWDYAARGGRPDPPYADWGAVLDRIYWDDPSSHRAKPIAPKEPVANAIGLVGMMGFVREWYSPFPPREEGRNRICGWGHHYTNYDCTIAYHVAGETGGEGARHPFRIALSGNRASGS